MPSVRKAELLLQHTLVWCTTPSFGALRKWLLLSLDVQCSVDQQGSASFADLQVLQVCGVILHCFLLTDCILSAQTGRAHATIPHFDLVC